MRREHLPPERVRSETLHCLTATGAGGMPSPLRKPPPGSRSTARETCPLSWTSPIFMLGEGKTWVKRCQFFGACCPNVLAHIRAEPARMDVV